MLCPYVFFKIAPTKFLCPRTNSSIFIARLPAISLDLNFRPRRAPHGAGEFPFVDL